MREQYSSRLWTCPYFVSDARQTVYCQGGIISFADKKTFYRYASDYCCASWERCTLARALNEFYDKGGEK